MWKDTGIDGDSGQTKHIPLSVGPKFHFSQLGSGPRSVVLRTGRHTRKGPECRRRGRTVPRVTASSTRGEEPKLKPKLGGRDVTQQQQVGGAGAQLKDCQMRQVSSTGP